MNKKMSIEAIENGIIHVLNQYPTIELVEAAGKYLGKGLMLEKKEEIVAVTVIVYGGAVSRKLIQYAEPLYEVKEGCPFTIGYRGEVSDSKIYIWSRILANL